MKIENTALENLYINIKDKKVALTETSPKDSAEVKNHSVSKALKTVSATYNHEINNALAPIMMIAQSLIHSSNDEELKSAMNIINSSAQQIASITKKLETKATHDKHINLIEYMNGTSTIDIG